MINKLLKTLAKLANGWVILLLIGAFVLLDNIIAAPVDARMQALAGGPIEQLDLMPAYTPETAYSIISAYGDQGRQFYALTTLTIDTIRPLIFALLFSSLITFIFRRAFSSDSVMQKLSLLPFVYQIADYAENAGIVTMLLNYPSQLTLVAQVTSLVTLVKFIFALMSIALVVIGLAVLLINRVRNPGKNTQTP